MIVFTFYADSLKPDPSNRRPPRSLQSTARESASDNWPLTEAYRPTRMYSRECNPGTRVPENPGNPPFFKPVNPGLCAGKNPGLTGLISGVSQYSVRCAEKRAETEST